MKRVAGRAAFFLLPLLFLFAAGGKNACAADYAGMKRAVIAAYQDCKTTVNVEKYQIYNNPAGSKKISAVMADVINGTPGLFYVGQQFSKELVADTKQIVKLHLSYSKKYLSGGKVDVSRITAVRQKLDAAVKKALKGIDSEMEETSKALLLHDYLVRTVAYSDKSSDPDRLSEAGALLNRKANCQGYSVAYRLLLEKAGIKAKCISSSRMAHMWNLVQIASKWYHVDVTWDDSVSKRNKRDIFGVALHKNFLLSNTGIEKEGHYGFSSPSAKKKTYDKAFWRGVETAFWKQGNRLLYGTASGIYARNLALQSAVRIQKGKVECLVHFKQDKYFFISGQSIYLFDVSSGSLSKKYTAKSGQYLMQLKCSGKKLSFRYDQRGKLYTVQKNLAEDGTFLT